MNRLYQSMPKFVQDYLVDPFYEAATVASNYGSFREPPPPPYQPSPQPSPQPPPYQAPIQQEMVLDNINSEKRQIVQVANPQAETTCCNVNLMCCNMLCCCCKTADETVRVVGQLEAAEHLLNGGGDAVDVLAVAGVGPAQYIEVGRNCDCSCCLTSLQDCGSCCSDCVKAGVDVAAAVCELFKGC